MHTKRGPYRIPRPDVIQPQDKSIRYIPLTQGRVAIVDAEDFEQLSQWNWCAAWSPNPSTFYTIRRGRNPQNGKRLEIKMHREIMRAKPSEQVDHINHDGLDCRKVNLRLCKAYENSKNAKLRKDNKTGYKGVSFLPKWKKWRVRIRVNGKDAHIGYFRSILKAARAHDAAAIKFHKKFAWLNFPNSKSG